MNTTPNKGMRFRHARILDVATMNDPDNTKRLKQIFVVTKIAQGTVYYRPDYGAEGLGTPVCCQAAKFSEYVGEVVS